MLNPNSTIHMFPPRARTWPVNMYVKFNILIYLIFKPFCPNILLATRLNWKRWQILIEKRSKMPKTFQISLTSFTLSAAEYFAALHISISVCQTHTVRCHRVYFSNSNENRKQKPNKTLNKYRFTLHGTLFQYPFRSKIRFAHRIVQIVHAGCRL